MISSLGCVLVDNVETFIALRFFEALGGCAGVVIARAIINDIFEMKEASAMFALMMVVSSLAPMLSPSLGGILLKVFSWQSIFITLFILGLTPVFLVIFRLKESALQVSDEKFSREKITANYAFVLKDKSFLIYSFSAGLAICAMFAYITGSSFVFTGTFGVSEQVYALLFGLNSLGLMITSSLNAKLVQTYNPKQILKISFLVMLVACVFMVFCSSFGFLAYEISLFLMLSMLGFIMPNTTTLAMARFKEQSGTASAILGTSQFALAGIVSFVVGSVGANTPFYLSLVMLICAFTASFTYFILGKNKE